MQQGFRCPDKVEISHEQCLSQCRMANRCLSLPTLRYLSRRRDWSGVPSVTQLIKGTRQAFLEITKPYFVDPRSRAFALLGISTHQDLREAADGMFCIAERNLTISLGSGLRMSILSGIPDYYDMHSHILYDYKTSGSYAISIMEKKKDWVDQLNAYRIMLEAKGYPVARQLVEAIIRDGGTWVAKKRGITQLMDLFTVPIIEDRRILGYFKGKARALQRALIDGYCGPCSPAERWYGRRKEYCEVREYCELGR